MNEDESNFKKYKRVRLQKKKMNRKLIRSEQKQRKKGLFKSN
jgi:hypothetical protein